MNDATDLATGGDEDVRGTPDEGEPTAGEVGDVGTVDAANDAAAPERTSAWIAWTVAAALALVAVVAVVQWQQLAGPAAAVDDAGLAAAEYVRELSNWDAADGLQPTYDALLQGATADFRDEVDEVFGPQVRDGLVAIDAVSTGTIDRVLTGPVETGEETAVEVVVVVEQLVVTGPTADPAQRAERVALVRMVQTDTGWLVSDLEMLSELQLAEEVPG